MRASKALILCSIPPCERLETARRCAPTFIVAANSAKRMNRLVNLARFISDLLDVNPAGSDKKLQGNTKRIDRINKMDKIKRKAFNLLNPTSLLNLANPVNPV